MSLSREEFRDGILMAGIPMTENEIESLLNVLDKDGDGEINYRFDQSAFNLWSRDFGYAKKIGNFWWSFMFRHEWWFIYNSYPMITIFFIFIMIYDLLLVLRFHFQRNWRSFRPNYSTSSPTVIMVWFT